MGIAVGLTTGAAVSRACASLAVRMVHRGTGAHNIATEPAGTATGTIDAWTARPTGKVPLLEGP
jgi:hypothetical protein